MIQDFRFYLFILLTTRVLYLNAFDQIHGNEIVVLKDFYFISKQPFNCLVRWSPEPKASLLESRWLRLSQHRGKDDCCCGEHSIEAA